MPLNENLQRRIQQQKKTLAYERRLRADRVLANTQVGKPGVNSIAGIFDRYMARRRVAKHDARKNSTKD